MSADESRINFRLSQAIGFTQCVITRETLEVHFWLSPRADASRMLKVFADGRDRIVAVAERRMRTRPGPLIRLASNDFTARC
ncbi:DUF1488 family protein [Paraburkholderia lacunae]|uniref:DUF1488 family protein n=1 Tax=Paraburkholderia lacunae TaxID=2211104 RepID=UPI001FCC090F|nr:DUF1488 family protein [Paraburkholderia lacunae]